MGWRCWWREHWSLKTHCLWRWSGTSRNTTVHSSSFSWWVVSHFVQICALKEAWPLCLLVPLKRCGLCACDVPLKGVWPFCIFILLKGCGLCACDIPLKRMWPLWLFYEGDVSFMAFYSIEGVWRCGLFLLKGVWPIFFFIPLKRVASLPGNDNTGRMVSVWSVTMRETWPFCLSITMKEVWLVSYVEGLPLWVNPSFFSHYWAIFIQYL